LIHPSRRAGSVPSFRECTRIANGWPADRRQYVSGDSSMLKTRRAAPNRNEVEETHSTSLRPVWRVLRSLAHGLGRL
jgi:hypothetical protein